MATRVTEVADGIFQLSASMPEMDFAVNHYLIVGEEPFLFHAGMQAHADDNLAAMATIIDPATLRWVGYGHYESDECGALNRWLDVAPDALAVQGQVGCMVSLGDFATREPRPLADGEVLDVGGHRLRWIDTPHLPHGWDAGLVFDETTRTLFCGDLFARFGDQSATAEDLVEAAIAGERAEGYGSWSRTADTVDRLRGLAALGPTTLAPMHAPAFVGDGGAQLRALADDVEAAAV
jgi:flavorubredoxin